MNLQGALQVFNTALIVAVLGGVAHLMIQWGRFEGWMRDHEKRITRIERVIDRRIGLHPEPDDNDSI